MQIGLDVDDFVFIDFSFNMIQALICYYYIHDLFYTRIILCMNNWISFSRFARILPHFGRKSEIRLKISEIDS